MKPSKIICKIFLKQGDFIVGEVDMDQLESKVNDWITLENKVFENNCLKINKSVINKSDIDINKSCVLDFIEKLTLEFRNLEIDFLNFGKTTV